MSETKTAYPLFWPPGKPATRRHQRRTNQQFKTSFAEARDACMAEIRRLGGSETIVSTSIPLKRNGLPQAMDFGKTIEPPGVAVYFKRKGKELCFACDAWNHVQDNMHAISLTIAALRGIARWGTGDMMEAAFTGFMALPAPGESGGEDPWKILGIPLNASEEQLLDRYRILAKEFHPDNPDTGDHAKFLRIKAAYDMIAQNLRKAA